MPPRTVEEFGLDQKTPAEIGGIKIEGENKWLIVVQTASKVSKIYV